MRTSLIWILGLLLVLNAIPSFAQTTPPMRDDSHKYRKVGAIVGAVGGFATGFYFGRAAYDTPDSRSKVWKASAISASAGVAGGFLIGWAIDNRRNRNQISIGSNKLVLNPLVSKDTKGLQMRFVVGY